MSQIIFFIGMSGAGKTEWGQEVARAYDLPFFDIDHYLESMENKSITQLFGLYGEPGFRKMESEALRNIIRSNEKPFVLSCGGGTPIDPANLALMKEHGSLIYLKAEIVTLVRNLENEADQRPLLRNDVVNPVVRLSELYEKRRRIYEQADYTLRVENLSIQDFEPILQACIKQH